MSKPMGSEWSAILISILLLNFLLLWQLGTSATSDHGTKAAADNGNTTIAVEADALRRLIDSLQGPTTNYSINCSNDADGHIKCSCGNSNEDCSTTEINFTSSSLDGYIPFNFGDFKYLEVLDLSDNRLSGEIPASLGDLESLKILNLSSNILTGSIPHSLTTIQTLQVLELSGNTLTGSIPASLTMMRSLKVFDLHDNELDGVIPQNLTGLQSLDYLDFSSNRLGGPIPESIGDCKQLVFINLGLNNLTGTIPKSLGTISSLETLDLSSNTLSGRIPLELRELSALQYLNLDDNNLEGNPPKELGDLVTLKHLSLTSNMFSGIIPDTYANLTHLEYFAVGGNYLSCPTPNYFGKWKNLTTLILLGNNFTGNLAPDTFTLPKLETLLVSDVRYPGIYFPKREVLSKSLISMVLRNCNINGSIPEYIGNWSQLEYLDLSFNSLSGDIPESFQKLNKLFLTNNTFTELPSWITSKPNQYFSYPQTDLSYNYFNVTCENITCLGLDGINIHPTRSFIAKMQKESCNQKHDSLFINCGGEEVQMGKDHYETDTSLESFYLSPSNRWAFSASGDYFWGAINDGTLVSNSTCEVSSPEEQLYDNFRLAPVSLTYYGLCLRKGNYSVTLHFANETFYPEEEDTGGVRKRVFDVYIQKRLVRKDLNIKEIPGEENKGRKLNFPATIHDGSLEIQFFWAGKGSLYNPPAINGPLISAISVTRAPRKLHPWKIAVITVSCTLFLLLLLAFMWKMGWIRVA